jgi:glutathione peroxidase-family protein
MSQFHELTMTSITGEDVDFNAYKDQVCLIVNVASA